MATVDIVQATQLCIKTLNAIGVATTEQYPTTASDPGFATQQIIDAILAADGQVCTLIAGNPSHGRRKDFLSSTTLATIASATATPKYQAPSRIGPLEGVEFAITGGTYNGQTLKAEESPVSIVTWSNPNPNGNALFPKYGIEGDSIYVNAPGMVAGGATSIVVSVTTAQFTLSAVCQASSEFLLTDVIGALAILFTEEGDMTETAGLYGRQWQLAQAVISAGQPSIPSLRLTSQLPPQQFVENE